MSMIFPQEKLEVALALLFPPGTAVAAERIVEGRESELWPAEAGFVAMAVPARRAEFAAGRIAARRALAKLGQAPAAIPVSLDRAPVWPVGIGGSIAHAGGIAVAAVRFGAPLGIDIEKASGLEPALWPVICEKEELASLPDGDVGRMVCLIFSAKEAAYKAQFPVTESLFGFGMLAVRLTASGFTARFRHGVGGLSAGHLLRGRQSQEEGFILSGVAI